MEEVIPTPEEKLELEALEREFQASAEDGMTELVMNSVENMAAAGRFATQKGGLDYVIGVLTEAIEDYREANRDLKKSLKKNKRLPAAERLKPEEERFFLELMAKNSIALASSSKQLMEALHRADVKDGKKKPNRTMSFLPHQEITVSDVSKKAS